MIKDPVVTPLEPFTPQEEQALFDKLDLLSVTALEDYIASAKTSLSNKALAPSWRVRVELALTRAELVLVREEAAAALAAAATPVAAPAPAPKAKKVKEAVADS
ncbi:MAG: hypothetical protein ABI330_11675 [Caldimonas sp.]